MEDKLVSQSSVLSRGWTKSIIKKFYPICDKEATNPHYKCASPMKLYSLAKVEQIEKTEEFKNTLIKSEKRKLSAKKAVQKKWDEAVEFAENVDIKIPYIQQKKLYNLACSSYDDWQCSRGNYDNSAFCSNNEAFLKRIQINFLRHECTNYESILDEWYGMVGVQAVHAIIQSRINDEILKQYPYLR